LRVHSSEEVSGVTINDKKGVTMETKLSEAPTVAEIIEALAREAYDLDSEIFRLEQLLRFKKSELRERIGVGKAYSVPGVGQIVVRPQGVSLQRV